VTGSGRYAHRVTICTNCGHENREGARFCDSCGAQLQDRAADREVRKTVTILFCDVTGSTALGETLDPEALRELLARYFERMRQILEAHGGTVEKFIGDAVMAVFGVPQLHEDDALRAARAAVEMRDALPELGVQARLGLATGEVVTGTAERLATGDAVNLAARLQQAAGPGEILIGESTHGLVRDAVVVEAVAPLVVKGKRDPVAAFQLLSVDTESPGFARHLEAPLVGRVREQERLLSEYQAVVSERSCHLVTLLGVAGVGKSRLVAEFLGAAVDAQVVRGRCLSYGEGITYWPVVEVLLELRARPADPAAAGAIATLLGESEQQPATPEQIAWAVRKTLEQAAADRPLVCVVDDIHWAEPGLLDLLEHVADYSRGVPILLLCVARPELLEARPGWAGGKLNATTLLLEPLSAEQTDELIDRLGDVNAELRGRIREAADGNPLFVEEMLAVVRDSGGSEVVVPPTIHALLASRLDQLDASERTLLECGSVEGQVFHQGAVVALAADGERVPQRLMGLVRKELVRPDQAQIPGDDAYRFRHLLIRDAAYDALPKTVRADLHERFAAWLDGHGAMLAELEEIAGYHLEQACGYRRELGREVGELALAARRRLLAAGRHAGLREDHAAAVNLLGRAAQVAPDEPLDLGLAFEHSAALFQVGRAAEALDLMRELAAVGAQRGDRVAELCGRIMEANAVTHMQPEGATDRLEALLAEALPELEAAGDDLALHIAYNARGTVENMRGNTTEWVKAGELAFQHATRAGQPQLAARLIPHLAAGRLFGTTPVTEMLEWIDQQEVARPGDVAMQSHRAAALAMLGRFDEARELMDAARGRLREQAATIGYALHTGQLASEIELLAGEPARALEYATEGCRLLEEAGERAWLSTIVGILAEAEYRLDRLDDAEADALRAVELGSTDDRLTQMLSRQVRAKVCARRGQHDDALRLAMEAVALSAPDSPTHAGDAYATLAEVLVRSGEVEGAVDALTRARDLYAQKGNIVSRDRVAEKLRQLTPPAATGAA
jgi:class 3 adenylate cyclase/tetratricopeptide (TPR) repeat protein